MNSGRMNIDAHQVVPGLWQGSAPPRGKRLPFDVLVLAAEGYQPPRAALGVPHVIRAPIDDGVPSPREIQIVQGAARRVIRALRKCKRVLVTCQAGLNRSGLIVAMTLCGMHRYGMYGDPAAAIAAVRRARGDCALGNWHFVKLLQGAARRAALASAAPRATPSAAATTRAVPDASSAPNAGGPSGMSLGRW